MRISAFTLHDVTQPGEAPAPGQQDFYTLTAEQFETFLRELKKAGYTSCDARTFRRWQEGDAILPKKTVLLTFDDGCRSHAVTVTPLLQAYGFTGVFFVTTDFIGQPGYVDWAQLRDMADRGVEIGSHGKSHTPLPQCNAEELIEELVVSREILEDRLGVRVGSIAAPGGFWSADLAPFFEEAGYEAVWLSDIGANDAATPHDRLKRVSVHQPFQVKHLLSAARGGGWALWKDQTRQRVIQGLKRVVGVQRYEALKARVFKKE